MQIFRVSPDHQTSAQYLDNRRLSKQVLELYQILRINLSLVGMLDTNTRYQHHPIVKHVYNEGNPYITDTFWLLEACDMEHQRRGGKRSPAFREDLESLKQLIESRLDADLWSHEPLPPLYVFGEDRIYGNAAYDLYVELLHDKWMNDTIPPRCGVRF
ncbi:pyrimidine dimer DNA glycosylase/endonuclease V [Salinicoccus bachuensis]|uniref:Pyrimidine dimer DNA glycosylase/endonuclease V n=1 Tax=Salinicoccus bachuensis TaxID=3136731 RepID=A0ABZ3CK16_9STAP